MIATKRQAIAQGAVGLAIPELGLRPESFAYLAAGGRATGAITIAWYPNGTRHVIDGRHRLLLARRAGETHVRARLIGYGPRLGVRWKHTGRIPI